MHTTGVKTQAQSMKDFRVNAKPKSRAHDSEGSTQDSDSEDGSHSSQQVGANSDKRFRREKKEKYRQTQRRNRDSYTPAISFEAANASGAYKSGRQVICYNCRRKGHYAQNCPKPQTNAPADD